MELSWRVYGTSGILGVELAGICGGAGRRRRRRRSRRRMRQEEEEKRIPVRILTTPL